MGNSSSAEKFLVMPLWRQCEFPFILNVRFCKPRETTIALTDSFWAARSSTWPRPPQMWRPTPTKWLLNAYKIPVAHMAEVRPYTTAYNVFIGKDADYCLTEIEVQFIPMHNNPCRVEMQNLDTATATAWASMAFGASGRSSFTWTTRTAAIAKVFRPDMAMDGDFGDSEYRMTVAAGVDVAFVVPVCGPWTTRCGSRSTSTNVERDTLLIMSTHASKPVNHVGCVQRNRASPH